MISHKFSKIYLEITNVCNLKCSFCHGTKREKRFLSYSDFTQIIDKIKGHSQYLYLHVLGEPLLHPSLEEMAKYAHENGFRVMLTTNGTLLSTLSEFITTTNYVYKVSISVHSFENITEFNRGSFSDYISECATFAKKCASNGVICVFRLWNIGCDSELDNDDTIKELRKHFPADWIKNRSGYKLNNSAKGKDEVYLEFGDRFVWPDVNSDTPDSPSFCYGLRSQIGILCDGTVVPCCLDAEGDISLGNIFDSSLDEIVNSQRARNIVDGFTNKLAVEKLCKNCGFAIRFDE